MGILDDQVDTFKFDWFPFQDIQMLIAQTDQMLEVSITGADQLKAATNLIVGLASLDSESDNMVCNSTENSSGDELCHLDGSVLVPRHERCAR